MIAGPHQQDRTLIELYANKMSGDPKGAAELFSETAEYRGGKATPILFRGRPQIEDFASKNQGVTYRVIAHLERKGDDNYADILVEGGGSESRVDTYRFRTDGQSITEMEVVGSRKP